MSNELAGCMAPAGFRDAGGNSGNLPTFCTTMVGALAQQQAGNAGGASMFEANVIPMMAVLQFLFFALSPLVAVVVAFYGAHGAGIYMKYVMFGIWTQSFLPVVDIINDYAQFISNDAFQNGLTSLMTSPTGTTNPAQLTYFSEMGSVLGSISAT